MGVSTVIAAATTVGGTAYSISEQRKAQKLSKRAAKLEERRVMAENSRNARRAAAQAQIQKSQIQANAAASGSSSSGTDNQIGAINSQLAGEQGFLSYKSRNYSDIINTQNRANSRLSNASIGGAISGLPGSLGFGLGDMLRRDFSKTTSTAASTAASTTASGNFYGNYNNFV